MPRGVPDAWLSAATLGGSTGVLLALVPLADPDVLGAPDAAGLTWLSAQTLALVAGYLCYFGLQRRAEPVAFSLIGYVMLVVSLGLGHLFMAESMDWTLWPALGLIAAALLLMHRAPQPAAHP
jgi:drug/metabolite transporter (DMT)-like permease